MFGGTSFWAPILLEQFQNTPGFEIDHGKLCQFPSQIGSSIATIRNMHLHFLV